MNKENKLYLTSLEFVNKVCQLDKGQKADLRAASNPNLIHRSLNVLGLLGVDLEHKSSWLPRATIGAAIAESRATKNGVLGLGTALAMAYRPDGNKSKPAAAHLKHLANSYDLEELCPKLARILTLINSKGIASIDYAGILSAILYFDFDDSREQCITGWYDEFYNKAPHGDGSEVAAS